MIYITRKEYKAWTKMPRNFDKDSREQCGLNRTTFLEHYAFYN